MASETGSWHRDNLYGKDDVSKVKAESNIRVYEVTNASAAPFMFVAYTKDDDISLDASYEMVKQLVKTARKRRYPISAIVIKVNDDGTYGELWGTTS